MDNLRVHHARIVTAWLADKQDRIELVLLPPYAPESNPDEYLNRGFKTALRSGPVSTDKASLLEKATAFMNDPRQMPDKSPATSTARQRDMPCWIFKGGINNNGVYIVLAMALFSNEPELVVAAVFLAGLVFNFSASRAWVFRPR